MTRAIPRLLAALAAWGVLAAALPAPAGAAPTLDEWLDSLARRMERRRDEAAAREDRAAGTRRKAEALLDRAKAAGNAAAEAAASKALENAGEAERKARSQREWAGLFLARLKDSLWRGRAANAVLRRGGEVTIREGDRWVPYPEDKPLLSAGSTIRTGPDGWVQAETPGGSKVYVGPGSEYTVVEKPAGWGELDQLMKLGAGTMRAVVMKYGQRFEVRTGTGSGAVRGTVFRVRVASNGASVFEVEEGVVEVADARGEGKIDVKAGYRVEVPPGGRPGAPEKMSGPPLAGPGETEGDE